MKVIVERLFIFRFSFPGKTIWNQLYLNKFWSVREIRTFRGQISEICSCARIKGSIWHSTRKSRLEQKPFCIRNFIKYYFNFTRNFQIFHYVNIIKVFGKKSREIVDLLSGLSLQNDFVPIVSEKLKTNNGGAKWFFYFLPETASALCWCQDGKRGPIWKRIKELNSWM